MPLPVGYTLDNSMPPQGPFPSMPPSSPSPSKPPQEAYPSMPPQPPGSSMPPQYPSLPPQIPSDGTWLPNNWWATTPSDDPNSVNYLRTVVGGGGQQPTFDPNTGMWTTPQNTGLGPINKDPGGNNTGGGPDPTPTPTPTPATPITPKPNTPITVPHQPTAPMIPVIPARGRSVTHPGPPPDAGGSGAAPVPNPTPVAPTPTNDPYARFAQQFTPQYDANGIPIKPPGTEDPNIAAAYYRMFANPNVPNGNPLFQYITPADVNEFRASGYQGNIGDWFLAKYDAMGPGPTGPNTVGLNPTTPTATTPGSPTPAPASGGAPPTPSATSPNVPNEAGFGPTLPTPTATPAGAPQTTPAAGTPPTNPNDEIQSLIDQYTKNFSQSQPGIETMLNPMYARQRQNLQDDMRASAAATGEINSPGGFGENLATAESNLAGQQSADLAGKLSQEYLGKMQQNTALAGLATNAGMQQFVSELDNSFKLTQLTSQDSLAKWIDSADNTLKKYGIDKNDVLQRYMTLTQSGDSRYAADQGVNAAALHAAAASAAANASTQAALQEAQMRQQLGMAELGVTRENNIGNFILGLINSGLTGINDISGLLNGFPPSAVVTNKP